MFGVWRSFKAFLKINISNMLLDPTAAPTSDATFDYLSYEICFPFSSVFYIPINFIKGLFVEHMIFNFF